MKMLQELATVAMVTFVITMALVIGRGCTEPNGESLIRNPRYHTQQGPPPPPPVYDLRKMTPSTILP